MAINFVDIDSGYRVKGVRELKRWISGAVEREGMTLGDLAIAFCSDSYITEENVRFLNHNYATDIITFPYNQNEILSGDLLISVDTIRSNAKEYGVTFQQELHRVIIHGVLHLIGYDDMTDADQEKMTEMENLYLQILAESRV